MLAMWKRMREYFGQSWVREYGDATSDAFGSWSDALQGFTEDQLARGVKACQDWRGDFPPNLGQFKGLCLTVRNERNFTEERLALEKQHGKPIESLEQLAREQANDSPVVRKAKAEMNAMLAGQDEFEFDGQTYRCQSKDAGMHNLGLNRRWTTVPQARQQDQPV